MSNAFFYEPFYDLERLIDHAFGSQQPQRPSGTQLQKQGDGAVKSFKPRYVCKSLDLLNLITNFNAL
jgi:hypothetical protein